MTTEGILARGKENFDKARFPNNSETMAYKASMKAEKPVEKPKEAKDAKSNK